MALTDKLTAIADAIRGKTETEDKLTLEQMVTAIAGIEAGGGEVVGTNEFLSCVEGMLYALTSGNYEHGTFTITAPLPNTETLMFSSGMSEISGVLIVADEFPYDRDSNTSFQRGGLYLIFPKVETYNGISWLFNATTINYMNTSTSVTNALVQGVWRIEEGKFYATANYNNNENYSPFVANIEYTWVVW